MAKPEKDKRNYRAFLLFLIVFPILLSLIITLFTHKESNSVFRSPKKNHKDILQKSDSVNSYQLTWKDYNQTSYQVKYQITRDEFSLSKFEKNNLDVPRSLYSSTSLYWGYVYGNLINNDKEFLNLIADTLATIRQQKNFSKHEFANVIMSFVQDIPYAFVHDRELCDPNSRKQCIRNERFGIHTPTEFLYTLLGDCDTRCILLYGLFERFGYDPKIATSIAYRHAILLLDLPTRGQFMMHKGKKYYFWESTSRGWRAGQLPPDFRNIDLWTIDI